MTEEKKKLSRKERRAIAQKKRRELYSKILDYMQKAIPRCSDNGYVNMDKWAQEGERFVLNLIKNKPQDSEIIRKAASDAIKVIKIGLDAYIKTQKGESNDSQFIAWLTHPNK